MPSTRRTRNNPSPSGHQSLQTPPKRVLRARRNRTQPVQVVPPTTSAAALVNSTTAPAPAPVPAPSEDDEAESDAASANPRPSSPLKRLTRAMSREQSRSKSRSASPPVVTAVVGGAKKLLSKVGSKFTKSTTRSGSMVEQQPATKARKLQKQQNTTYTQPIGVLSRDKRSHSQVSVASHISDDDVSPPMKKKRKNVPQEQENDSTSQETVFNTHIPKVILRTFHDHQSHTSTAPTPSLSTNYELDLSDISRLDVADQSTPRHIEQLTSIPTVEAEASSPSIFKRGNHPTQRELGARDNLGHDSDDESINLDEVSAADARERRSYHALYTNRQQTPAPKTLKVDASNKRKFREQSDSALTRLLQTFPDINRRDLIIESAITIGTWAKENRDVPLPKPEKFRAMLEAHKAELSKAEASNHNKNLTPEPVSQKTSSHQRDEPATSTVHASPQYMVVATPSRHSSPTESLASTLDSVMEDQTSEVASESLVPAAPAVATPKDVTVTKPRPGLFSNALSTVTSVIASPVKWFGGRSQNAVAAADTDFTFSNEHGLPMPDIDNTPTRRRPARQRKMQYPLRSPSKPAAQRALSKQTPGREEQARRRLEVRSAYQANIEEAEEESNANIDNKTLNQDGLVVGGKRKRAPDTPKSCMPGTFSTPYLDSEVTSQVAPASAANTHVHECLHKATIFHRIPKNIKHAKKNPLPKKSSIGYRPSLKDQQGFNNLFTKFKLIQKHVKRSRHSACAVPFRNNYWAQLYIIQSDMTAEEVFWDDELRTVGYLEWLMRHELWRTYGDVEYVEKPRVLGDLGSCDSKYYEEMRSLELNPSPPSPPKARTYSVPDNEPSDYEDEDTSELSPVVSKPGVEASKTPALQEINPNQRPPSTPKPANAVPPKTFPHQAKTPSNLRQVKMVSLSPQVEQDVAGKENVETGKAVMYAFEKDVEEAVAEATEDSMGELKAGAIELLAEEGLESYPNAIY